MSSKTPIHDISNFDTPGDANGWFASDDAPVVEGGIYTTKFNGASADLRKIFGTPFKKSEIKIKLRMRIPQKDVEFKEFTFSALGTDGHDFINLSFTPYTENWQEISGSWTPTSDAPLTQLWLRLVTSSAVSEKTAEFDYIEIEQA